MLFYGHLWSGISGGQDLKKSRPVQKQTRLGIAPLSSGSFISLSSPVTSKSTKLTNWITNYVLTNWPLFNIEHCTKPKLQQLISCKKMSPEQPSKINRLHIMMLPQLLLLLLLLLLLIIMSLLLLLILGSFQNTGTMLMRMERGGGIMSNVNHNDLREGGLNKM